MIKNYSNDTIPLYQGQVSDIDSIIVVGGGWRRRTGRKSIEAYLVPQFGKRTNEREERATACWRALGADAVGERGSALRTHLFACRRHCCWNFQCIGILTDPAVTVVSRLLPPPRRRPRLWWNSAVIQHYPTSSSSSPHSRQQPPT